MRAAIVILSGLLAACTPVTDNSVLIASASSFLPALKALQSDLELTCNTSIKISSASTGALITQARQGAPFDLIVSADPVLGKLLTKAHMDPPFARSPLAFWHQDNIDPNGRLAIANPRTAPFGQAAIAVIGNSKVELVTGSSAAQAFSFVKSGAASAGYVPLVLLRSSKIAPTQYQIIDPDTYPAILLQTLRLQQRTQVDCLAKALASKEIGDRLLHFGYQMP